MASLPDDLSKLKVPELKAELSKRGLAVSGLKAVLVERLQEAVKAEAGGDGKTEEVAVDSVDPAAVETVAEVVEEAPAAAEEASTVVDAAEVPASVSGAVPVKAPTPPAEPPTVHDDTVHTSSLPDRPLPTAEREDAPPPTSSRPTPAPVPALAEPSSPTAEAKKRKRTASPERAADAAPPRKAPFKPSKSKSPLPPTDEAMTAADPAPAAVVEPVVPESEPAPVAAVEEKALSPETEKPKREPFKPRREPSKQPSPDPPSQPAPSIPDEPAAPAPKVHAGPPVHLTTRALYISNLVRPFTLPQIKELVEDFGELESFWMDAVKSHAYVVFVNESSAVEARRSLDSAVWPQGTGRPLSLLHLDPSHVSRLTSTEDDYKKTGRPRQDLRITHSPDSPDATADGWLYTLQDFSLSAAQRGASGPINPASAAGRMLAVSGAISERPRGLASAVPQSATSVGGHIGAQARASMADRQREGMQRDLLDSRDRTEGSRALPPHLDRRSLPLDPGVKMRQTTTLPSLDWAPVSEAEAKRRMDDFERRPPVPAGPPTEPRWGGGGGRGGGGWGRGGHDGPRWSAPERGGYESGWRGRGRGWGGPRW